MPWLEVIVISQNPSMEVSDAEHFSEENGTASDSISDGAEIENSTFSDSGIPESMENNPGVTNGGDISEML